MIQDVIQVRGLYKRYGKLIAVKGIDFTVRRGEIFGLIGPDGAGKTTTFHVLAGVMEATEGKVDVLGKSPVKARLSTGYLTQSFSLYLDLSIDENLRYLAGLRQVDDRAFERHRAKYLKLMDLERFSDRLTGRLSGGMKQKLALCAALISQPEILLLDEPTTGVDPISRREFWDILTTVASEGIAIAIATPYLDEAERCDRLALMHEGEIQQIGTLAELRESLALQRLEVRTPDIKAAEQILNRHRATVSEEEYAAFADVQIFGDRLDVLVKQATAGEARVRELFRQHQFPVPEIRILPPTLENVFVTRLRTLGEEPPFIPFPRTRIEPSPGDRDVAISAQGLTKIFGDFPAVKPVNLAIRYGEIYGLLGANGAGKTTTIKMLCGLLEPTAGEISLAGEKTYLRHSALRRRLGYMSQKFTLYNDLSILENLEFYCGAYGVPRHLRRTKIEWVLQTCGLVGREKILVGQLPGGWKQRISLGASVMHEPEILFLDEPTSGVDPLARRQFWRLINEFARQGTAILVTTHYLEEAEQCNRIGLMVAGEIAIEGSPSQIKASQPGQLIEIATDRSQAASKLLKTQFTSWRVSVFGDRLHLVLDDPDREIASVYSLLESANLKIFSLQPIPFSLEDAFIGIVQRTSQDIERDKLRSPR